MEWYWQGKLKYGYIIDGMVLTGKTEVRIYYWWNGTDRGKLKYGCIIWWNGTDRGKLKYGYIIDGMVLTGENWSTGVLFDRMVLTGENWSTGVLLMEWYWQGKTEVRVYYLMEWYWQGKLKYGYIIDGMVLTGKTEVRVYYLMEWYWQGKTGVRVYYWWNGTDRENWSTGVLLMEWYWQGKTRVRGGKRTVKMSIFPPQIPHVLTWELTQASRVTNRLSHCTAPTNWRIWQSFAPLLRYTCQMFAWPFPRLVHLSHSTTVYCLPVNSKRAIGTQHSCFFCVQSHVLTADGKPTGGRCLYKFTVPTMWQIWTGSW